MLEATHLDGRGRTLRWQPAAGEGKAPAQGPAVATPALLWPDTSLAAPPAWVEAVVTAKPHSHPGKVEILSGGTWFHPVPQQGPLAVLPPRPAPTAAVQVLEAGPELAVFHDAAGWASNPHALVGALLEARRQATPGRALWAPGLGAPEDYALWAYVGVDLFDASPLLLAAVRGQALTTDGPLDAAAAGRLLGSGPAWGEADLLAHNLEAARRELERVRHAVETGTLRALAERRVASKAASVELLRRFDREHGYLEAATPVHRTAPLPALTVDSLNGPEVERYRRRVQGPYEPPQLPILLLLPCSQRKPYKTSRSHRAFARVLDACGIRHLVHEVMVTSPLGLVPRELEEVYPAQAYDIPVTGHWLRDEEAIVRNQLAAILSKGSYRHVVVHTGQATFDVLRDLLPEETRHTCLHHPTRHDDLERLGAELARLAPLVTGANATPRSERKLADFRALLSFQFSPAVAAALADGARMHGRMPFLKLERDGVQLGMTTLERGVVSLTLEGAKALAGAGTRRVRIGDFTPKKTSTLFAVGVESADPDVRAGEDVVVVRRDGAVVGCGVAQMDGESMTHLRRGVAVALRHVVEAPHPAEKAEVLA